MSLPTIGARVPQHKAAIEAAKRAGAEHIAYTSIVNPGPENPAAVAAEHRETEEAILASGLAYTFLRNNHLRRPPAAQRAGGDRRAAGW